MDEDSINRPVPLGWPAGAACGEWEVSVLGVHGAKKLQMQLTSVARCHLRQADDDEEGLLAERSVPTSSNICQNWLIECFA